MGAPRTIDAGPALLGGGGGLLLIALFLPWWDGNTAWTVFESLDLVLATLAGCAIAYAVGRLGEDSRLPIVLGAAALVVVGSQMVNAPAIVGNGAKLGSGAWLALASSILMLAGALQQFARFSFSIDVAPRSGESSPTPGARPEPEAPAEPKRPVRLMTDDQRTEAMPVVEIPDEPEDPEE